MDEKMDENEAINTAAAHCPNCGAEYRVGFHTCSDCGVPLEPGPAPTEGYEPGRRTTSTVVDPWAEATRRAWGEHPADEDDHPAPAVVARLPLEEAMLLVGRLEEAGISARVDADVSSYYGLDTLNRLKAVLVPRSRLEDARRVVAEVESGDDRI